MTCRVAAQGKFHSLSDTMRYPAAVLGYTVIIAKQHGRPPVISYFDFQYVIPLAVNNKDKKLDSLKFKNIVPLTLLLDYLAVRSVVSPAERPGAVAGRCLSASRGQQCGSGTENISHQIW